MKRLTITAAALALLATPVLAQETAPQPPAPPMAAPDGPPEELTNEGAEQQRPEREMRGGRERAEERREARRAWRHGRHGGPRDMGARFQLEVGPDGEVKLDVRCAPNEPMQACADIMNRMLDRITPNEDPDARTDL
jgi:hypothetical protein